MVFIKNQLQLSERRTELSISRPDDVKALCTYHEMQMEQWRSKCTWARNLVVDSTGHVARQKGSCSRHSIIRIRLPTLFFPFTAFVVSVLKKCRYSGNKQSQLGTKCPQSCHDINPITQLARCLKIQGTSIPRSSVTPRQVLLSMELRWQRAGRMGFVLDAADVDGMLVLHRPYDLRMDRSRTTRYETYHGRQTNICPWRPVCRSHGGIPSFS